MLPQNDMKRTLLPLFVIAAAIGLSAPMANAVVLDLLTDNQSGNINGAHFTNVNVQSTGSGILNPFVRLSNSGNNTSSEGYNADARPVMADVNTSGTFTHDIRLSTIGISVNPGSLTGSYYGFLLDINQQGSNPLLSLDRLQIFTSSTALSSAATYADLTSGATLRWDMDVGPDGNSTVHLNYNLNTGSGSGDMFVYIPVSFFAGAAPNDFLYLYSQFGAEGGVYSDNDGFQEWAGYQEVNGQTVPDGGSAIALLGVALVAVEGLRRKIKAIVS